MPEPIGSEISIDVKALPELKDMEKGAACFFKVKGIILGKHTHTVGKTERMVDIRIDSLEYEEEDDDSAE
jgi:hypothetical protein